ncbi:MAG: hypothetical protein BWY75_03050 [bacterium ADurb.Bin425]|nr:MAG: hypothetical protein BWY75_03050 [bacterium ADurb.Bin425]
MIAKGTAQRANHFHPFKLRKGQKEQSPHILNQGQGGNRYGFIWKIWNSSSFKSELDCRQITLQRAGDHDNLRRFDALHKASLDLPGYFFHFQLSIKSRNKLALHLGHRLLKLRFLEGQTAFGKSK